MSIPATQMRPGMIIKFKDDLHLVFSVEHRTPGNLRAFIQAKLRNVRTGAMFVERFRSPDPIERVIVDGHVYSTDEICVPAYRDACERAGLIGEAAR